MKKYIYVLSVFVLSCLLFFSCKKENSNDLHPVGADQIKKIKNYYNSQQKPGSNENISEGAPLWEKTIFNAQLGKYLVPVTISPEKTTGKYNISKYLLISGINSELAGEYVFALQKTNNKEISNDRQIQNAILHDIYTDDMFIARRALQPASVSKTPGNYINTKIKKGNALNLQKSNTDTVVVANSLPMANCEANGGIIVEIEWWYQEYDQHGNVVYEEYVYSTFECWVSGGGGSGGGTGTSAACGSITSEQADQILSYIEGEVTGQATYTSIGIEERNGVQSNAESFGNIRKVSLPKYSFYTMRLFFNNSNSSVTWFANYSGIVYKMSANDFWKWESINFVNVSEEGNPPICVDYEMNANVASPIIDTDKKRAQSGVNYSVSAKIPCLLGWRVKSDAGGIPIFYLDAQ